MSDAFPVQDNIIYQEMMSHPALFMHSRPTKVAIIGDKEGEILKETLQHPNVTEIQHINEVKLSQPNPDHRTKIYTGSTEAWFEQVEAASLDIIIFSQHANPKYFKTFFDLLHADGILVQQAESPFHLQKLKSLQEQLSQVMFSDIHFITFPQPNFPTGLRSAIITKKTGNFRRAREKDIFNKHFTTRYYNFDMHRASLVLPEFMRLELLPTE